MKADEVFDSPSRSDVLLDSDDEPPTKRLRTSTRTQSANRWIPGGRGGGGRRMDMKGSETMPATPQVIEDFSAPIRTRKRDNNQRKTHTTSRFSARNRNRGNGRPRYSTAAAAAAATHTDGYKPREERGWEEYHPDLDLDMAFPVLASEEVDGIVRPQMDGFDTDGYSDALLSPGTRTPSKRRVGRPQRTQSSMLQSLLTPEAPKFVPAPGPNPRERLTLPKPSYRILDPFLSYEQKEIAAINFVNQSMANVGYQESELFLRPDRTYIRQTEGSADEDLDLMPDLVVGGGNSAIGGSGVGRVEYDMDEQDVKWLEALNKIRTDEGTAPIKPAIFEITMTKIEKEWHALEKRIPKPNPKAPQTQRPRSSSAAAVNGEPLPGEEPDSKCAICDDGDCENANAIVFCDGCDLAVHQECYGVPYIPEGQWLCRKCQLVGNSRPSCIFCPNEGGAFKQTNNSKWAHLLCATWIPEVTIGNPSLMEPITDVEKVPNSRWKLGCYICKQDMGASIQCSDGRCYEPFHLTCARQAGLFLKMKLGGGQNSLMDASQLRAFCHKHTPSEWRMEHDTEKAFEKAVKHFKSHFQGQIWADSKASALAMGDTPEGYGFEKGVQKLTLTNKKGQKPKTIWRLPSGAPVIPDVILRSMEEALLRFSVPKKKEYIGEICKYWTLKREARRGAALLKRLQLQMDTFSSFEVTRRDYKAQGATGRARLDRRVEFAENLARDLERIREICVQIKRREEAKRDEARLLKDVVDTIYFPIAPLITPILERAFKLDPRGVYRDRLVKLQTQVTHRHYTSVNTFFADFAKIFETDIGFDASDQSNMQALYSRPDTRPEDLEQRERRTLARRIVKAAHPMLEDALKKEAELNGRPFEQQMKELDDLLFSRRPSLAEELSGEAETSARSTNGISGTAVADSQDIPVQSIENNQQHIRDEKMVNKALRDSTDHLINGVSKASNLLAENTPPASMNGTIKNETSTKQANGSNTHQPMEPPTPPMSTGGANQNTVGEGGIPWYVEQFDPLGITVYEERWTGKDVLRDLSEELSDMDEDELQDLGDFESEGETKSDNPTPKGGIAEQDSSPLKRGASKKKRRGNSWADRSFRHRRQR